MALGSAQPLTEMRTKNLPSNKGRPEPKVYNLIAICHPIFLKIWEPPQPVQEWLYSILPFSIGKAGRHISLPRYVSFKLGDLLKQNEV
jgi:hypothetical protein